MIPTVKVTPQGFIAPTREDITAGLWQMFKDAFGDKLTIDERTPQGQLVTSLTAVLRDKDAQLIELGNNFDPRYAVGKWQEALGAIYFLDRSEPKPSVVQLEFEGLNGAVVPIDTESLDDNDNVWITTQQGTIDSTGHVLLWAKCETVGPISAVADSIDRLVDAPTDVDRVTNPSPAVAGSLEESRLDYEIRRAESVAANAQLINSAVHGAVFRLPGVIDVRVIDNPTDNAITVGATNYPMIRNSLLVSVVGGDDYAIAGRIMTEGGTGCSFVGNTDVLWKDTDNYDDGFPPEYNVKFLRPDIVPLYWRVRVQDEDLITAPLLTELQQSIVSQMLTGQNRARIGGTIIPMSFNCDLDGALRIIDMQISTDNTNWHEIIEFGIDEMPATSAEMVEVVQYA